MQDAVAGDELRTAFLEGVVDVDTDERGPEGQKNLSCRIGERAGERTLMEAEVGGGHARTEAGSKGRLRTNAHGQNA